MAKKKKDSGIYIEADAASDTGTKKIDPPPTVALQAGTERTLYAIWNATSFTQQEGYVYQWVYDTGQGIWFNGTSETSTDATQCTYTAPGNAIAAGIGVYPKPGSDAKWTPEYVWTHYYDGWAVEEEDPDDPGGGGGGGGGGGYSPPVNTTPAAPSNVSIDIVGNTVIATVTNYQDENANDVISIQIVEDDAHVVQQGDVNNVLGIAKLEWSSAVLGGHRYKARALAHGKSGEQSPWSSYTANSYTTPLKTSISKVVTVSSDSVDVRWEMATGAETYTLEYTSTTVGGIPVFDTASQDVQQATGIMLTHYLATSLTVAQTWYFRVRAVNPGGASEWSNIVSTVVGITPDAPSVWSYTSVGKIGTPVVLNWIHSSEDGSDQSGARIGIVINNGNESTITLTTQTSYSYDTSNLPDGAKIKWRVSTKGTQGIPTEWGPYSEYREFVVYSPPSLVLSVGAPDGVELYPVIGSFPFTILGRSSPSTQTPVAFYISITANSQYDVAGEAGVRVHVAKDQEIYSTYIPAKNHYLQHQIYPGDVYLKKGINYTVTVSVAMTNGLTAEASQIFTAKWNESIWTMDADLTVDKDKLIAYIRPFCTDKYGFEIYGNITLSVYRIDYDGYLTKIGDDIPAGDKATVSDPHMSLDYARYRVVALDNKTGMVYFTDLGAMYVGEKGAVFQWEGEVRTFYAARQDISRVINDWSGSILRLPYNIDVADDVSPDTSLVEYIGREHPVSYYGTQQGSTSKWSADFPKDDLDTLAKIRALAIYPGDVYVREPYGSGYWANVKVSYNISYNNPFVKVSFAISRVEGGA